MYKIRFKVLLTKPFVGVSHFYVESGETVNFLECALFDKKAGLISYCLMFRYLEFYISGCGFQTEHEHNYSEN